MGEGGGEVKQEKEKCCQNCKYYNCNIDLAATFCEKKKRYLVDEEAIKNVCDEWVKEAVK
jgi:hypothetical protein